MLSTMFNRGSVPALEALMHYSSARHKTIANNIANVETVGYKAMDVPVMDFQKALARAFEDRRGSPTGVFEMPATRGVQPASDGLRFRLVESRETGILKHIENNVDLDIEMGKLVKNGELHNLAASLLSHQFTMMREAISERVIA
jgi:flagellar basal-body rod protein FlgB